MRAGVSSSGARLVSDLSRLASRPAADASCAGGRSVDAPVNQTVPLPDAAYGPTRAGFRAGVVMTFPLLPGVIVFGLAVGALSAQKGLTLFQTWALTSFLNGGAAQIVGYQIWPQVWTPAALIAVVGVVSTVNLRFLLMGASLRPWLGNLPSPFVYASHSILTDLNWSLAVGYRARGGRDVGMLIGAGLFAWVVWSLCVIPGWLAVAFVADPRRWGLDLMMVVMFSTMSVPVLRRARRLAPFLVAGAVGLVVGFLFEGFWFIIAGALAGAAVGAFGADNA